MMILIIMVKLKDIKNNNKKNNSNNNKFFNSKCLQRS